MDNKITYNGAARQNQSLMPEILQITSEILNTNHLVSGTNTDNFSKWICEYTNFKHAILVHSGSTALQLMLKFSKTKPSFVPTFTFKATANAMVENDLVFSFSDCNNVGIGKSNPADTLFVGTFGLRNPNQDYILEDAAQHWPLFNEYPNTNKLAMAAVSFDPFKHISCLGNGGAILLNDTEIYLKIIDYVSHGKTSISGTNIRMSELDAAILHLKSKFIAEWQEKRKFIASQFNHAVFSGIGIQSLATDDSFQHHALQKYVVYTHHRDELITLLSQEGIETKIHYQPIHSMHVFSNGKDWNLPNSLMLYRGCLSIPLYPELTADEISHIKNCLSYFSKKYS